MLEWGSKSLHIFLFEVNGLYGGDVDALTAMYTEQIQQVNDLLAVPTNATVCPQANPEFDPATTDCTLFETGYEYTGLYYQGMFKSPLYYAQVSVYSFVPGGLYHFSQTF